MNDQFNVFSIKEGLGQGKFSLEKFSEQLLARSFEVNEKYEICSLFFEKDYLAQISNLSRQKQNGEILGKLFGVPFSITENFALPKNSRNYSALYDVTILRRLLNEGAVLLCKTQKKIFNGKESELDFMEIPWSFISNGFCQASFAVRYGLAPIGLAVNSGFEWVNQMLYSGVFSFVPSRNIVPYTGLVIEENPEHRFVFFGRNLRDMCLFCEVCSGGDGRDKHLFRTLKMRILVNQKILDVFNPRVCVIRKSLSSSNKEENTTHMIERMSDDKFKMDSIGLSDFFDLNILFDIYETNFVGSINAKGKKSRDLRLKDLNKFFENFQNFVSDILTTSDVIAISINPCDSLADSFEYKLINLFYYCGFPIVGIPLLLPPPQKFSIASFFVGSKRGDDKLVSVVNCINNAVASCK